MKLSRAPSLVSLLTLAACSGGGNNAEAPPPSTPPPSPPPASAPAPILPAVTPAWHVPTCSSVTGAAPVTFTADGGLTRAPIQQPAAADYFTYGVVALEGGSTLAALVGTRTQGSTAELYFSTDAGCSWEPSGQTFPYVDYYLNGNLTPAGTHAYAWGQGELLHVIEPTGIARPFKLDFFPYWVSGPHGFAVDPQNPARVRVAMYDCLHRASCGHGSDIYETTNEGADWARVGTASAPHLALHVRFSPTDFDHAIAPFGRVGDQFIDAAGYVTLDGSNSWLAGQGPPKDWYTDEVAIGLDGQTVWLLATLGSPPAITPRSALYVSYDGGLNYQEAFAASDENPFASSNASDAPIPKARIFPHPTDAHVVYLAYTSHATATSYLYRYDADLDELTKQAWPSAEGAVWSLAFNPSNPEHLYLGLAAAD